MSEMVAHILTRIEHLADMSRDLLELQRDILDGHLDLQESLKRIEDKKGCHADKSTINWNRVLPTLIWGGALIILMLLQIPLKDAVTIATKLSTG